MRRRVAIIPMGFCFPGLDAKGGDLPPRKECPKLWRERLFDHLPKIDLMLLVGGYAQSWHMGSARAKYADRNNQKLAMQTHSQHSASVFHPIAASLHGATMPGSRRTHGSRARILPVVKREVRARLS